METVSKHKKSILVALLLSAFISVGKFAFGQSPLPGCDASFKQLTGPFVIPAIYTPYNWAGFEALNKTYQSYIWDFGDGRQDTGKYSVMHQYAKPGKYLVTLKVYHPTVGQLQVICEDARSLWVSVSDSLRLCDASFSYNVAIFKTLPPSYDVLFTAKNQGYQTYTWDFGDGTQDTGRSVSHHYAKDGKYDVTLKVYSPSVGLQGICENKKTETLILGEQDTADLCKAQIIAAQEGNKVTMRDAYVFYPLVYDGTEIARTWDWGDGATSSGETTEHNYAKSGKFLIALTKTAIHNPCYNDPYCKALPIVLCSEKYTFSVEIGILDTLTCAANIGSQISGLHVKLFDRLFVDYFDNRVYEEYKWDFGDGSLGDGRTIEHLYSSKGIYKAKLTKSVFKQICPPNPNGVRCLALPIELCSKTYDVVLDLREIEDSTEEKKEITTYYHSALLPSALAVSTYPVPAQDVIHFEVKNATSDLTLRLFSAMGNQVKEVPNIDNYNFTVEVPELESGAYMYSLSSQEGIVSKGKVFLVK